MHVELLVLKPLPMLSPRFGLANSHSLANSLIITQAVWGGKTFPVKSTSATLQTAAHASSQNRVIHSDEKMLHPQLASAAMIGGSACHSSQPESRIWPDGYLLGQWLFCCATWDTQVLVFWYLLDHTCYALKYVYEVQVQMTSGYQKNAVNFTTRTSARYNSSSV